MPIASSEIKENIVLKGRIDDQGKALLPVILIASEGMEIEIEATIALEFSGAMAISEDLAKMVGWRCLGARFVQSGSQNVLMSHFLGTIALGGEPIQTVVLSGLHKTALLGRQLLAGRKLHLDYSNSCVLLE